MQTPAVRQENSLQDVAYMLDKLLNASDNVSGGLFKSLISLYPDYITTRPPRNSAHHWPTLYDPHVRDWNLHLWMPVGCILEPSAVQIVDCAVNKFVPFIRTVISTVFRAVGSYAPNTAWGLELQGLQARLQCSYSKIPLWLGIISGSLIRRHIPLHIGYIC